MKMYKIPIALRNSSKFSPLEGSHFQTPVRAFTASFIVAILDAECFVPDSEIPHEETRNMKHAG